jgi:hypothetical protein
MGIKGSWRWIISKFSLSSTAFMVEASLSDMVMRMMEPLLGMGRGLPIGMNLSPKSGTTLDAGAITFT